MATQLLLVRHAQTLGNTQGRVYGHAETPLTSLGEAQAQALGRRLSAERLDAAYASDLSRALETARHVVEGRSIDVAQDRRLRELHFGDWEERATRDVMVNEHEAWQAFVQGRLAAPNGEHITALRTRTAAALREYVARHRDQVVLVVSHGTAIMAAVAEVLGVPTECSLSFQVDNASVTRLVVGTSGRFILAVLNDATHAHGLSARPIPEDTSGHAATTS